MLLSKKKKKYLWSRKRLRAARHHAGNVTRTALSARAHLLAAWKSPDVKNLLGDKNGAANGRNEGEILLNVFMCIQN